MTRPKWRPGRELDTPEPSKVVEESDRRPTTPLLLSRQVAPVPARPCSVCGGLSVFTTKLGRAVHPACEPAHDWPSPALYRRLVGEIAATLNPVWIHPEQPSSQPYRPGPRPTVIPPAPVPCARCGTDAEVVRWLPHDVWRCFDHGPLTFPVQPWELRGLHLELPARPTTSPEVQP